MRYLVVLLLAWAATPAAYGAGVEVLHKTDVVTVLRYDDYQTNIGIIRTKQGTILIDPAATSTYLTALGKQVKQNSQPGQKWLLNTHSHSDHSGGNDYFQRLGYQLLNSRQQLNGLNDIRHISLISHSQSDRIFYHRDSNILFSGDIYTSNWHPTFYAGGLVGFKQAVEQILTLANAETLIVPGHGKPTGVTELKQHYRDTENWVAKVKALQQRGMSVAEISQDPEIARLLNQFNGEKRSPFLPQKAVTRFIERTLAMTAKNKS